MDIELGTIPDRLANLPINDDLVEERVPTSFGDVLVNVVGSRKRPAMVTFHDLGQNANSGFQSFFLFTDMASLSEKFCVYHINAPGCEEDAPTLPDDYIYPTMDDLATIVGCVLEHFNIRLFVGLGVGAGANVLARYAIRCPKHVDALILVNFASQACGWVEWGYQKVNVHYLRTRGVTNVTVDYLMWHHFGKKWKDYESDLVREYFQYFCHLANPKNLGGFIESYIWRTDLGLSKETQILNTPVLQLVGSGSPHIEDTVIANAAMDPSISNWIKVSDCGGLVLDECPEKATEAIFLFLQGQGYLTNVNFLKWQKSRSRQSSIDSPSPLASPAELNERKDLLLHHRPTIGLITEEPAGEIKDETGTRVAVA